jgi:hypothetical protein
MDKKTGYLDDLSALIEKGMVQATADHLYKTVKVAKGAKLKKAQTALFDRCVSRMVGGFFVLHDRNLYWMETGFMTHTGLLSYTPRTLVKEAIAKLWDSKFSPHEDKKTLAIDDISERLIKIAEAVEKINDEELTSAFADGFRVLPESTQDYVLEKAAAQQKPSLLAFKAERPRTNLNGSINLKPGQGS